jgi:hypothetical protein
MVKGSNHNHELFYHLLLTNGIAGGVDALPQYCKSPAAEASVRSAPLLGAFKFQLKCLEHHL